MKQRGSALIISMMLIATVGAAAFGIARLLYADTSIATTYENGTVAYYAAESGIEEGFLRYKYSMNAEVPYASWTLNDNKVFRTNLKDNIVENGAGAGITGTVNDPAKQYYDLGMGYLGTYDSTSKTYKPFFYHDTNDNNTVDTNDIFDPDYSTGDYNFLKIPKDEARTFDLSNIDFFATAEKLDVGFKFIGVKSGLAQFTLTNECKAMVEVKFLVTNTSGLSKEYKALTSYNPGICANMIWIEGNKLDGADAAFANGGYTTLLSHDKNAVDNGYYYSLSDILTQVLNKAGATILETDKVSMTIKPLYYPADVYFTNQSCDGFPGCAANNSKIVTGPYTYINSTGYYGGTTRTLTANIDRQSGTLYDLYGYVLFEGN